MYSSSMAILLVFLSDDELEPIKHVHIGLVVCHVASSLTTQAGIFPFVKSVEGDSAKARERCTHRRDIGGACSYSLLLANYGDVMALPTELPYCLVYIYDDEVEDKLISTPRAALQGCALRAACATPCSNSWTRILPTGVRWKPPDSSLWCTV